MNCSIFIVNYNADDHTIALIDSLKKSLHNHAFTRLNIFIIDNSERDEKKLEQFQNALADMGGTISLHSDGINKGYFGGLSIAQSKILNDDDCVIYCNPDILVGQNFFNELDQCFQKKKAAIVAPSIICLDEGFDQNPMYTARIRKNKLNFLSFVFSNNFLYRTHTALSDFIRKTFKKIKKSEKSCEKKSREIYAPHGSMLIFFDVNFFKNLPPYPCFLFGEELFLAEEARNQGLKIIYDPKIEVTDIRHASINSMDSDYLRELSYESIRFILKTYYQ